MATTRTTAGTGIKDQIKDTESSVEQIIRQTIQKQLQTLGVDADDILCELVWPFAGIHCPALFSEGQNGDSGTDKILAAIMIHFSNKENLTQLPEAARKDTLNTLHYLYKMVETVGKYADSLFDVANLYHLKQGQGKAQDLHDELFSWYGSKTADLQG